jgi:hypothetical protein
VGATHRFQGYACIPAQPTEVVTVHVKLDGVLAMTLHANISRPDLKGKTPCGGSLERHGFAGFVPPSAMEGKHMLAVFAVNPAGGQVELGQDELCDGVTCTGLRRGLDLSHLSAWSDDQTMMALL